MKKLLLIALCLNVLTYCTVARYKEGNLFIADLHPGGESINFEGTIFDKGELKAERSTGESTPALEAALETISRLTTP